MLCSPINRALRIISAPAIRRFTSPKYAGLLELRGQLVRCVFVSPRHVHALGANFCSRPRPRPRRLARTANVRSLGSYRGRNQNNASQDFQRSKCVRTCVAPTPARYRLGQYCYRSLEIRVPLVDIGLLRNLAPLFAAPTRPSKRELAGTPQRKIPNRVLNRRKTGFSVPVRDWILKSKGACSSREPEPQAANRGLRGWARMIYSHFTGN